MATATINNFGLQSESDRTMYATWTWDKKNTNDYKFAWDYYVDGIWFKGDHNTTTDKESIYNAPSNAITVRFRVIPQAKTRKVRGKQTAYWKADWTTYKQYSFSNNPPSKPPTPSIEVKDYTLTAKLANLDVNASYIQFKVVQDDTTVFKTSDTTIRTETNSAQYSCIISPGHSYKVACRAVRDELYSEWSEFSDSVSTIPAAAAKITVCRANSKTSVYLEWNEVPTATSYDIEYATKESYLGVSNASTTESGIESTKYELTGLETGQEYFFRVRAANSEGESGWAGVVSVVIGKEPAAPTTWSSTTTAVAGEALNLYWVHNAEDGSQMTYADVGVKLDEADEVFFTVEKNQDLKLVIEGAVISWSTPEKEDMEEEGENHTRICSVDTSKCVEGNKITWRVRTAGITKEYGDWSIERIVDIYAPPTLAVEVTNSSGTTLSRITGFPFYISALAGPASQAPIGYQLTITSNSVYETIDDIGNNKLISKGEAVYSKYFDISQALLVEFSANNIDLENNVEYIVACSVTMNSGLTAEATTRFTVAWTDVGYEPNAEIGIDYDNLTALIRPYCEDDDGNLVDNLYLSVYRREFDGSFTEIIKNVDNSDSLFVTDPHPALDYARYRIVATDKTTGAVSYYDVPGYPVGETGIILQWDEEWSTFDTTNEDDLAEPTWSGSLLKLPYNVDVSDKYSADVSMVEYIGRRHPVSYYGTQVGSTAVWSVVIEKSDEETLYALRRLAIWMGNVYVREPSGSGYWANVNVSFSQKHRDLTIPVTLNITRVEGGM